ncbi:uncharacterized protein [Montipora foliosa]|uniref:uncharacterized protein n=1 Tax=Montipora foliosa TaxID=591990 RepID=UPI0035F1DD5C
MEIAWSNGTSQKILNQTPKESEVTAQEDQAEISPFLFPAAIGALLMLMLGGFLFSNATPLCKTKTMPDSKIKRQFERKYGRRTIRFHNVPQKIAKDPCSVLQQENNDIVDAVKKEYHDLPQYQPVSGLVGNVVGLHGRTCAVNECRPEMTDRGESPIPSTRNADSTRKSISLCIPKESEGGRQNNSKEQKNSSVIFYDECNTAEDNAAQRIPSASSGIGSANSLDNFEADSLEEFPLVESDTQTLDKAVSQYNEDPLTFQRTRSLFVTPTIDRGVHVGGRSSVLEFARAPSCSCVNACNCSIHGENASKEITSDNEDRIIRERLTWGHIAQRGDIENLDNLRLNTPSALVSGPETRLQERRQCPLRREDLEQWLSDVEASRKTNDNDYVQPLLEESDLEREEHLGRKVGVSGPRRIRAPLHESLQLLKSLELISEDGRSQFAQTKSSFHRGGRASCLEIVRAPSSICICTKRCTAHCQGETTADKLFACTDSLAENTAIEDSTDSIRSEHQRYSSIRTERLARGGRLSNFNQVRASSNLCIHGPSCRFHCQKAEKLESATKAVQTCETAINANLELRGASVLGEKVSIDSHTFQEDNIDCSIPRQRDAQEDNDEGYRIRGASSFGNCTTEEAMRGASSFALAPSNQLHANQSKINLRLASVALKQVKTVDWDSRMRPKQPLGNHRDTKERDAESNLEETRGASCFASLNESITGTSSVTLSVAVQSDGESFLGYKSSDQNKGGSTLNPRMRVKKTTAATKLSKTMLGLDGNNNRSSFHQNDDITQSRLPEREKVDVDSNTIDGEIDGQLKNPTAFDSRILKVGKDAAMMTTLLNALTRHKEEKRKEKEGPCILKRNNMGKIEIEHGRQSLAGNLNFSVFYKAIENSIPLLYVGVLGLENVSERLISPVHSIYVKFCLTPKFTTWRRTKKLNITGEQLVFKDYFIISGVKPADLDQGELKFIVVCIEEQERVLGKLEVPLAELKSRDKIKRTCALQLPDAETMSART